MRRNDYRVPRPLGESDLRWVSLKGSQSGVFPWQPREAGVLFWASRFRHETRLPAFVSSLDPLF